MDLSLRRAQAVKNYLIGKGIMPNRMATEGFGFTKPVALNGTNTGRSLNRRVEIQPF
jgi:OOP family OmpA-OmpF porin